MKRFRVMVRWCAYVMVCIESLRCPWSVIEYVASLWSDKTVTKLHNERRQRRHSVWQFLTEVFLHFLKFFLVSVDEMPRWCRR